MDRARPAYRATDGGHQGRRLRLRRRSRSGSGWAGCVGETVATVVAIAAAIATAGCATNVERFASAHGMRTEVVDGQGFRHLVIHRDGAPREPLHVYLEHDGTPWVDGRVPAADPTPRHPLALRLMARDPAPVAYLGRPCYFAVEGGPACNPNVWTDARYSPAVVASLVAALERVMQQRGHSQAWLVGHSGGGTLAVLVAARMPPGSVVRVVTVAANLDVGAWASHHGYIPLFGSLDPVRETPLGARIPAVHYIGGRDDVVPPASIAAFRARNAGSRFEIRRDYDHVCCWEESWTALLQEAIR